MVDGLYELGEGQAKRKWEEQATQAGARGGSTGLAAGHYLSS